MLDNPFALRLIVDEHLADAEKNAELWAAAHDAREARRAARAARWARVRHRVHARPPRRDVTAHPVDRLVGHHRPEPTAH